MKHSDTELWLLGYLGNWVTPLVIGVISFLYPSSVIRIGILILGDQLGIFRRRYALWTSDLGKWINLFLIIVEPVILNLLIYLRHFSPYLLLKSICGLCYAFLYNRSTFQRKGQALFSVLEWCAIGIFCHYNQKKDCANCQLSRSSCCKSHTSSCRLN